jgi:hypothetical protein
LFLQMQFYAAWSIAPWQWTAEPGHDHHGAAAELPDDMPPCRGAATVAMAAT